MSNPFDDVPFAPNPVVGFEVVDLFLNAVIASRGTRKEANATAKRLNAGSLCDRYEVRAAKMFSS